MWATPVQLEKGGHITIPNMLRSLLFHPTKKKKKKKKEEEEETC